MAKSATELKSMTLKEFEKAAELLSSSCGFFQKLRKGAQAAQMFDCCDNFDLHKFNKCDTMIKTK